MKVINNEHLGVECFMNAQKSYSHKLSLIDNLQKEKEDSTFGMNSGAALVMISTSKDTLGKIIHVNEEIEALLDFKRTDLVGRNVSMIMPPVMGLRHDTFI
jgi:hypothetical protein